MKRGDVLTLDSIKSVRPMIGIPVKYLDKILGKKLKKDINVNFPIFWEDLNW